MINLREQYQNPTPKVSTPTVIPVAKTATSSSLNIPPPKTSQLSTPTKQITPHGKFFDGGLVSKVIDVLRLPEFAIASFNKGSQNVSQSLSSQARKEGKSAIEKFGPSALGETFVGGVKNIIPGISKRTQYGREEGDYNAGAYITDNPVGQSAVNFTASLGAPALPVGKTMGIAGEVLPKLPGVSKVVQTISKFGNKAIESAKASPKVAGTLEQVPGLEYFRNPEAGKILEGAKQTAEARISSLYNQINDIARGLTPQDREQIGHIIEGKFIGPATSKLVQRANYIKDISDKIGQEVVDAGLMSPESFANFKGRYLSHIADVVKTAESDRLNKTKKMLSFTSDSLKQRKNILGSEGKPDYIKQFQYPTFKALSSEIQNVESVKAVKQLADKFGTKLSTSTRKALKNGELVKPMFTGPRTTKEGRVLLSDILPGKVGSQFKEVSIPSEVADYISRKYSKNGPNLLEKIADRAMNAWKLGKTVYSGPGYHVRNLLSNQILSDFATGAGLPSTIVGYSKAVKAYLGKGDAKTMRYLNELKDAGVISRVNIAEGVENLRPDVFGQGENVLKKVINSPKKFQNASEETAKLNVYSFFRNKGMNIKDAAAKAEEAIFSPYKINPNERSLARNITPFYSFTRQALPLTAKTAFNRGNTLTKYDKAKTAIESLSPEGSGQEPPNGGQSQVRLPIKDKNGNYIYADPSYVYPHGNFDPSGGGQGPFGLSFNPLLTEAASQLFNKDLYFNQPIAKSSIPQRAKAQRIQHGFQTFSPNIVPTDFLGGISSGQPGINLKTRGGSKLYDAFTNQPDYAGRTRNKVQALLDTFGLKSMSVNPDQTKFDAIDKAKALKAIQSERRSVAQDKRLLPQDKQKIMIQLNEAAREILKR